MPMLSSGYREGTSEAAKRHERMRRAEIAYVEAQERQTLTAAYLRNCRDVLATALELGIRTTTLVEKLQRHGIQ